GISAARLLNAINSCWDSTAAISKIAYAQFARASRTWNSSMMKSLRRQGSEQFAEAARKLASDPWKNSSSVKTESAAAPADSNSVERLAASKSFLIKPRDGDAFLSSVMTAKPVLLALPRALRNPRGLCEAARLSMSGDSALE